MQETASDRSDAAAPDRRGTNAPVPPHTPDPPMPSRWRLFTIKALVLGAIWAVLTDFRADAWVFGLPAVLAGAGLVFLMPAAPAWRLSPQGALVFALWFSVQSVRGAVDVSRRAFSPRMPLRPGFRRYPIALPSGAPRVMFLNTITLLPGTLAAEQAGDAVMVHMLDTRADLDKDLGALERRIAALFALSLEAETSP